MILEVIKIIVVTRKSKYTDREDRKNRLNLRKHQNLEGENKGHRDAVKRASKGRYNCLIVI